MNDLEIMLIIPGICFIIGLIIGIKENNVEAIGIGIGLGFIIFLLTVMFSSIWSISTTSWETARPYKFYEAADLTFIECPDHSIEIWHDTEKITTLNSADEYGKYKEGLFDKIEYRHQEVFGPDYDHFKVIFRQIKK